jgi:2-keto-4-pentenoate hydratase/2-oxohepta-3-ene-1,7-dioic acid hydratase in catechol pathway
VRFARYEHARETWVGRVEGDNVVPLAPGEGLAGQESLLRFAVAHNHGAGEPRAVRDPVSMRDVRLLTPTPAPPSVRDFYAFEAHVATARGTRGLDMEPEWYELPVFYFSNPGAVLGPDDAVTAPAGSAELDYELEVAAVMGYPVRDCSAADGLDAIAGFTVMNDWSARDLQRREMRVGLGPSKGKDFATSLGPFLVTPDELPGFADGRPRAAMTASVNGVVWSRGELADIHHAWGDIIAHAARDATLRTGDVLGSGTVGTGCILELAAVHSAERYPWLRPGDVVELEVEGIGALSNRVNARDADA